MARSVPAIALAAALGGCVVIGDADDPIATIRVAAPAPNGTPEAVIVLPGFGDDAEAMRDRGFAEAVQRAWPHADVLLTDATFAYYSKGVLVPRLEQDVIAPARQRKVRMKGAVVAAHLKTRNPGRNLAFHLQDLGRPPRDPNP